MNVKPTKPYFDMTTVVQRLFTIRNIANLAAEQPEEKAETYILQDIIEHISDMVQSLIEEVEEVT